MKYLITLLILFTILLSSCGQPKLSELQNNDTILAFGDSLTQGVGVQTQFSYPNQLQQLSGLTVINAGISGETTGEGLARFVNVIDQYQPNLIILIEGGNDILKNIGQEKIKQNLQEMINIANTRNIELVLIGVPEKKLLSNTAPFYKELAKDNDLVFDDSLIGKLLRDPSKKSDPVHFNQAGYAKMAEEIYELLQDHGALK